VSTPFCLGVAAGDIHQDQHESLAKHPYIYLPSKQNIYLFERARQVDLPKEAVGLVLESVVVTSSAPETILLTEEIYEGVVSIFREARDLCIEDDKNITDYVTEDDSDDDSNDVVCADCHAVDHLHFLRKKYPSTEIGLVTKKKTSICFFFAFGYFRIKLNLSVKFYGTVALNLLCDDRRRATYDWCNIASDIKLKSRLYRTYSIS